MVSDSLAVNNRYIYTGDYGRYTDDYSRFNYGNYSNMNFGALDASYGLGSSIFGAGYATGAAGTGAYGSGDYIYDYTMGMRRNQVRLNGSMAGIDNTANLLHNIILQNEQDQVMEAYNKYVAAVSHAYGGAGAEMDVKAYANQLYQQKYGLSIIEDIRSHTRSHFATKALKVISLGMSNSRSGEDNIAEITGMDKSFSTKASGTAGTIAGVLGLLAAPLTLGIFLLSKGKIKLPKP